MVFTKLKIFDQSTRNKPSVLRELTGLTYLLVQEELTLKDHKQSIFLLTDCSSLAYLQRNRFAYHKLGEVAIFLNTFRNLNVYYAPGQSLFWSDLLSRQFNSVYMQDDRMLISKEWSKVVPYISSKHVGKCLSTEHLMDYIFHKPNSE